VPGLVVGADLDPYLGRRRTGNDFLADGLGVLGRVLGRSLGLVFGGVFGRVFGRVLDERRRGCGDSAPRCPVGAVASRGAASWDGSRHVRKG
jgi:hypothetical protein